MTTAEVSSRQRSALGQIQRCVEQIATHEGIEASTSTTVLTRWRDMLTREAELNRTTEVDEG